MASPPSNVPRPLRKSELVQCAELLRKAPSFSELTQSQCRKLCKKMTVKEWKADDVIFRQGDAQAEFVVVAEGSIRRVRENKITGQKNVVYDPATGRSTYEGVVVGSLHTLRAEPTFADTVVLSPVLKTFAMSSKVMRRELLHSPDMADGVIHGLARSVRSQTKLLRTPLLEQRAKRYNNPILVNSLAASIESFYRSALNAVLNQRLTGHRAALFPDMHIQVPMRAVYINGFKEIRRRLDETVHPEQYASPMAVRVGVVVAPGLLMTPFASTVEACNASHLNPEPLWRRATRGNSFRSLREICFGLGINQLSDHFIERMPTTVPSEALRTALGSIFAGIAAGYLSHVPHNLCTLKLMDPRTKYSVFLRRAADDQSRRLPRVWSEAARRRVGLLMAIILPKGVLIRSTQIAGSFVILNGFIHVWTSVAAPWLAHRDAEKHTMSPVTAGDAAKKAIANRNSKDDGD